MAPESPVVRVIRETLELAEVPPWHAGGAVFDALGIWGNRAPVSPEEVVSFVHGALKDALEKRLGHAQAMLAIAKVDGILRTTEVPTGVTDRPTMLLPDTKPPPPNGSSAARSALPSPTPPNPAKSYSPPPPSALVRGGTKAVAAKPKAEPGGKISDPLLVLEGDSGSVSDFPHDWGTDDTYSENLQAVELPPPPEDVPGTQPGGRGPALELEPEDVPFLQPAARRAAPTPAPAPTPPPPATVTPRPPPNSEGPLALDLEWPTEGVSVGAGDDMDIDVDLAEQPSDRQTMLVRTQSSGVPVVIVAASDRFGVRLSTALGRDAVAPRTVQSDEELRIALLQKPFVVVIDATDFAPIEPEELASALRSLSSDTVLSVWGVDMPYGRSVIGQLNTGGTGFLGLAKREGLEPLLDILRSRRR